MDYDSEAAGLVDLTSKNKRHGEHDGNQDSDDEIQDWSVVASVSKRGEKDFEPLICEEETRELSWYDQDALSRSRNMMFSALGKKRGTIVSFDDLDKSTIYINVRNTKELFMLKARGKFLETMGHIDRHMVCHFGYEEALYLIERGTCLARLYDDDEVKNSKYQKMLPLSLEAVYALLIHDEEQLGRYLVYSMLKRNGYIVTRHKEFDHVIPEHEEAVKDVKKYDNNNSVLENPLRRMSLWTSILAGVSEWLHIRFPYKFALSYSNIFSYLSWKVKDMVRPKPKKDSAVKSALSEDYFITFNVWKPMANFRKKSPPLPDFQVVTVKAWSLFPRAEDLKSLISRAKTNPDTFKRRVNHHTNKVYRIDTKWDYSRSINMNNLKFNEHNITFAIVDSGIVNFAHLSDCCFADEGPCWRDHWANPVKNKNFKRRGNGNKRFPREDRNYTRNQVNRGASGRRSTNPPGLQLGAQILPTAESSAGAQRTHRPPPPAAPLIKTQPAPLASGAAHQVIPTVPEGYPQSNLQTAGPRRYSALPRNPN
ncbi:DEKNAAC100168 [Brettanomyces naardenensis]|uniref:DEKNAAC100168 n=1 Tax=Brettanomyces naardenensis TaxID=13370 RepID=A0A448YFY9_BRENA|nr:DEKNAAC100168 [Brettanomyces naardenensis]